MTGRIFGRLGAVLLGLAPSFAAAVSMQTLDDAWWTGPILAANAATLPQGHFLVEPYLFDSIVPRQQTLGSLTYALYGVTDKITAGVIPRLGYTLSSEQGRSSGVQLGDAALQAQYRLAQFEMGSWIPTTSMVVGETFPTGRYDRLGNHPNDGFGAGVHTTTVSLYTQDYFWMPTGRILRARLDLSYAFSDTARVRDVSVYGTPAGFMGRASPGDSYTVDAAGEYSVTRHWVLALDSVYQHNDSTRVAGNGVAFSSGASESVSFAPAVEYNWNATIGVIVGVKFSTHARNTSSPVIPVVALNMVY